MPIQTWKDLTPEELAHFWGTMNYYSLDRSPFHKGFVLTDGAKVIWDQAHWFLSDIIIACKRDVLPTLSEDKRRFLVFRLKRVGEAVHALIEDGNGGVLNRQRYEWVNFPLDAHGEDGFLLFVERGSVPGPDGSLVIQHVVMLPSER